MSYLLLNVDGAGPNPTHSTVEAAMGQAFGPAVVEIMTGVPHLYRKQSLMGKMPADSTNGEGTWNFAVLGRREGLPFEMLLKALEVCKDKVRRVRYFPDAVHCYLLQIEGVNLVRSKELMMILSGYEIESAGALLAVAPLVQPFTHKKPAAWADQESEMSFSHPADALPALLVHDKPASSTNVTPPLKVSGYTELPTCASCFERLDASISGVQHMLCTHKEGCRCHFTSTCRVCTSWRVMKHREPISPTLPPSLVPSVPYVNNTSFASSSSSSSSEELPCCEVCNTKDSLWACLVCTFIGCGRYTEQHTLKHCFETGHTLVMELGSQKIWDYDGDLFIHRLLIHQTNKDVLPDQWEKATVAGKSIVDAKVETKHELICLEYSHLLAHQMESARRHFEELLSKERHEGGRVLRAYEEEVKALKEKRDDEKLITDELENGRAEAASDVACLQAALAEDETNLREAIAKKEKIHTEQETVKKEVETALRASFAESKELDTDIASLKDQIRDMEAAVEMRRKCKNIDTSQSITFMGTSQATGRTRKGKRK
eukprot:TRINITY_DN1234_c0_g1_i1.p1 TRINITY_DN1234_c0_g1~~TRINITY_DN1234_c0_g1_i1.p1  ORF type:complete len:546 (+),score=142.54 TRINITY_DN1234_c0_g1_i1:788-2425(+)